MTRAEGHGTPYVIVAAIDFAELSDIALSEAFRWASRHESAEVHVAHVAGPDYVSMDAIASAGAARVRSPTKVAEDLREHAERRLEIFRSEECGSEAPFDRMVVHFLVGSPAEAIAQLASDLAADLVVVGTHGRRGARRLLMGSIAEAVVRSAPTPVLVARSKHAPVHDVPEIDPPCPSCIEKRRTTGGVEFWCEQHTERHGRRHTYHIRSLCAGENMPLLLPMDR